MKRETLRAQVLALLRNRAVPNSHAVRGWAFAMCHAAALEVVNAAHDDDLEILQTRHAPACSTPDAFCTVARDWLFETSERDLNDAWARHERGDGRASVEVFLHHATLDLLQAMTQGSHPWATLKHLNEVAYPAIDAFGDPGVL